MWSNYLMWWGRLVTSLASLSLAARWRGCYSRSALVVPCILLLFVDSALASRRANTSDHEGPAGPKSARWKPKQAPAPAAPSKPKPAAAPAAPKAKPTVAPMKLEVPSKAAAPKLRFHAAKARHVPGYDCNATISPMLRTIAPCRSGCVTECRDKVYGAFT